MREKSKSILIKIFSISPIHKLLQKKQNDIEPELLKLISSNITSNSIQEEIIDDKNENTNNINENKGILIKNELSYKDLSHYKIKLNRKNNFINYNFINKPNDPVTQKIIKSLKMNEKEILNHLSKIMNNEKLLKSQSYLKLTNSNPNNINIDNRKLEKELKQINENKKGYLMRLDEIKSRIKSLEYKYEKNQGILDNDRQEKLNRFLDKQNKKINQNDDESNLKIKNLQKENKILLINMHKDLENKMNLKMNEIETNKKLEKQNKLILLKNKRDEERKDILKRKNKSNEETRKLSIFINKKPEIHKYLYQKVNRSFNENENKRLLKENNKRKLLMKPMQNDIKDMLKNYQEYKNKKNLELEEKTKKLKKSWSERNILIPNYKTQLRHMIDNEDKILKLEKKQEKEKKKEMKKIQIDYSKKIENHQIFNMKQFNERQQNENDEDYILRNKNINKPSLIVNNINKYCDLVREKIFLNKNSQSQDNIRQLPYNNNKNITNKNNINSQILKACEKTNKSIIAKLPNLNHNFMNLKKLSIVHNVNKNNKNDGTINKIKNSQTIEVENINYKGTKEIKQLIDKNGFDKNTFEMANCKLESLNERKKQKSLLLKHEGGFINNPSLGEEVCDILIDSMTAKLSLINEIDNIQNKTKNKPQLVDIGIGPSTSVGIVNPLNNNKKNYNEQKSIEEVENNNYSSSLSKEEQEE